MGMSPECRLVIWFPWLDISVVRMVRPSKLSVKLSFYCKRPSGQYIRQHKSVITGSHGFIPGRIDGVPEEHVRQIGNVEWLRRSALFHMADVCVGTVDRFASLFPFNRTVDAVALHLCVSFCKVFLGNCNLFFMHRSSRAFDNTAFRFW